MGEQMGTHAFAISAQAEISKKTLSLCRVYDSAQHFNQHL